MSTEYCDPKSLVSLLSALSGGASFAANLVASFPQVLETYQQKSVAGLSPVFITIWVTGDLTSFIGCFLTDQLFFQYILGFYFLLCDGIMCGQYYYYGVYLKKHPHKHPHYHRHRHHSHSHPDNGAVEGSSDGYGATEGQRKKSSGSLAKAAIPAAVIASNIGQSNALPIEMLPSSVGGLQIDPRTYGVIFAWLGASLYFFSRIPQLLKNYQRKSTDDLSPVLFACTLFGNVTYTASILLSCDFVYNDEMRWEFFLNELPYIIGSAGTIIFDLTYFYQVWLYRDQSGKKTTETEPLLVSGS